MKFWSFEVEGPFYATINACGNPDRGTACRPPLPLIITISNSHLGILSRFDDLKPHKIFNLFLTYFLKLDISKVLEKPPENVTKDTAKIRVSISKRLDYDIE